ncbi:hypothetical protein PR202_gb12908 [Eleusine coracana subsp. coracana]|uniref:Uncharacterized protein n=1 Tax=Eleusine coracana subsp. coracana TaxID=191504 RepID=A0AAV5ES94_ELECO|nr:hypothetical protein PR202_gb12908 [Eleusine coracana subsp. coracana]
MGMDGIGESGDGEVDFATGAGVSGKDGREWDGDLVVGAGVSANSSNRDGDGDLAATDPSDGVRTSPIARRSCGRTS